MNLGGFTALRLSLLRLLFALVLFNRRDRSLKIFKLATVSFLKHSYNYFVKGFRADLLFDLLNSNPHALLGKHSIASNIRSI